MAVAISEPLGLSGARLAAGQAEADFSGQAAGPAVGCGRGDGGDQCAAQRALAGDLGQSVASQSVCARAYSGARIVLCAGIVFLFLQPDSAAGITDEPAAPTLLCADRKLRARSADHADAGAADPEFQNRTAGGE